MKSTSTTRPDRTSTGNTNGSTSTPKTFYVFMGLLGLSLVYFLGMLFMM